MKKTTLLCMAVLVFTAACNSDDKTDKYCNFDEHNIQGRDIEWCEENALMRCSFENQKQLVKNCINDTNLCYKKSSGRSVCILDEVGQPCKETDRVKCSGDRMIKCINGTWTLLKDCKQDNQTCVYYGNDDLHGGKNARCQETCDYRDFLQNLDLSTGSSLKTKKCSPDNEELANYYCTHDGYYELEHLAESCNEDEICEIDKCVKTHRCEHDKCVDNTIYRCMGNYYSYTQECFTDEVCTIDEETQKGKCVEKEVPIE